MTKSELIEQIEQKIQEQQARSDDYASKGIEPKQHIHIRGRLWGLNETLSLVTQLDEVTEQEPCEVCRDNDFKHYQYTTKITGEALTECYIFNVCPACGRRL